MSWEDDDFGIEAEAAGGAPKAAVAVAKPKAVSAEAMAYEKKMTAALAEASAAVEDIADSMEEKEAMRRASRNEKKGIRQADYMRDVVGAVFVSVGRRAAASARKYQASAAAAEAADPGGGHDSSSTLYVKRRGGPRR